MIFKLFFFPIKILKKKTIFIEQQWANFHYKGKSLISKLNHQKVVNARKFKSKFKSQQIK